jgi:hypothetical protein
MAIYAQFDERGAQVQLASNSGFADLGAWLDALPAEFAELKKLREESASADLSALREELATALEEHEPQADVRSTVEDFIAALEENDAAEFVLVTSGMEEA